MPRSACSGLSVAKRLAPVGKRRSEGDTPWRTKGGQPGNRETADCRERPGVPRDRGGKPYRRTVSWVFSGIDDDNRGGRRWFCRVGNRHCLRGRADDCGLHRPTDRRRALRVRVGTSHWPVTPTPKTERRRGLLVRFEPSSGRSDGAPRLPSRTRSPSSQERREHGPGAQRTLAALGPFAIDSAAAGLCVLLHPYNFTTAMFRRRQYIFAPANHEA